MCGNTQPQLCVDILKQAFSPSRLEVSQHLRGTGFGKSGEEQPNVDKNIVEKAL